MPGSPKQSSKYSSYRGGRPSLRNIAHKLSPQGKQGSQALSPLNALKAKSFAGGGGVDGDELEEPQELDTRSSTPRSAAKSPGGLGQSPLASFKNRETRIDSSTGTSKLSDQKTGSGMTGSGPEAKALQERYRERAAQSASEKEGIMDQAIDSLRKKREGGVSASDLFKLSSAFLKPTRTGSFFETLGNAAGVAGDVASRRENLDSEIQKLGLAKADLGLANLAEEAKFAKLGAVTPAGIYGKNALDEGLTPGTPEFIAHVQKQAALVNAQKDKSGPEAGTFDRKTGNFVADNGVVIKSKEVEADRKARTELNSLQTTIAKLTPDVVKKAEGWDWTTGDPSKYVAGKFFPKQLSAQVTVNAASLKERLGNLPPGPASDKDILQAKSTFPGFSDAKALQDWIDLANGAINRYIEVQDRKYGQNEWYGSGAAPGKTDQGVKPEAGGAKPGAATNPPKPPKPPKPGAGAGGARRIGEKVDSSDGMTTWMGPEKGYVLDPK